MRAVLDSNVLARAVYSVGGPAEECLQRLCQLPHVLIVSGFLLDELCRVLRYPRMRAVHGFDDEKIEQALALLRAAAVCVDTPEQNVLHVVPHDPDDDYIVAAVVGGANVLCTRNRHLYHDAPVAYCRQHAIEIMDDIEILARLRAPDQ